MAHAKMSNKAPPNSIHVVLTGRPCSLPVWNDDQILQENWGSLPLSAPTSSVPPAPVKEGSRPARNSARDGNPGSSFADAEGREIMEEMMKQFYSIDDTANALPQSEAHSSDASPADTRIETAAADAFPRTSPEEKATAHSAPIRSVLPVRWCRVAEVVKPFRPMVHLNQTPFIDPYTSIDTAERAQKRALCTASESKESEGSATVVGTISPSATVLPTTELSNSLIRSHKISRAVSDTTTTTTTTISSNVNATGGQSVGRKGKETIDETESSLDCVSMRTYYPEVVSQVEELRCGSAEQWQRMPTKEAIARYRALAPLQTPYDPTLKLGCAERPMEACAQRYSTALRHKIAEVDALSALSYTPPFLMRAFHSVLLVLAHAHGGSRNDNKFALLPKGSYLWELIYPHAPGTCHPIYNPNGKYAVRLFVEGAYRKVIVDDTLPVDALGRAILTLTGCRELWPALLAKAFLKAWGVKDGPRMLCTEPEQILCALLGNWMPEYVCTGVPNALTWAVQLLRYREGLNQNRRQQAVAPGQEQRSEDEVEEDVFVRSAQVPSLANKAQSSKYVASANSHTENSGDNKSRGNNRNNNDGNTNDTTRDSHNNLVSNQVEQQQSSDTSDDSVMDGNSEEEKDELTGPLLLCGLRASSHAEGNVPQLFSIVRVEPFRHTLAVQLQTAPPVTLGSSRMLTRESTARDVQYVLSLGTCQSEGAGCVERVLHDVTGDMGDGAREDARQIDCWFTLEELMTEMDSLLVWRCLDHRYRYAVTISGDAASTSATTPPVLNAGANRSVAVTTTAAGNKKGLLTSNASTGRRPVESSKSAAAPSFQASVASNSRTHATAVVTESQMVKTSLVRWCCVTCTHSEELAMVGFTPYEREHVIHGAPSRDTVSTTTTTAPAAVTMKQDAQTGQRCVRLDYYKWQRAEPLSLAAEMVCTGDKVNSSFITLSAGRHIFRVTVPGMTTRDRLMLLCNADLELFTDLIDAQHAQQIYSLIDTGLYPAVTDSEEDYVWLKRRLRVSVPTRLTMVLTTLPPGEDGSVHRYLSSTNDNVNNNNPNNANMAMSLAQSPHGKKTLGISNNNSSTSGGASSRTPSPSVLKSKMGSSAPASATALCPISKEALEELDDRVCAVSILHYVKLLCINLDSNNYSHNDTNNNNDSTTTSIEGNGSKKLESMAHAVSTHATNDAQDKTLTQTHAPVMVHMGEFGRLIQLDLEPNEQGYLVMACTRIPAMDEAKIERSFYSAAAASASATETNAMNASSTLAPSSVAESSTAPTSPNKQALSSAATAPVVKSSLSRSTSVSARTGKPTAALQEQPVLAKQQQPSVRYPRLYGAGQWKLSIRSDAELRGFEMLTPNLTTVQVEGELERGGVRTLFRYACTILKPTHMSLRVDLITAVPHMPLRVVVAQAKQQPPTPCSTTMAMPSSTLTSSNGNSSNSNKNNSSSSSISNNNNHTNRQSNNGRAGSNSNTSLSSADKVSNDAAASLTAISAITAHPLHVLYDAIDIPRSLFVPNIFLDLPDKYAKTGLTYVIEGLISAAEARIWEEACRRSRAARFSQLLLLAEKESAARLRQEEKEWASDPAAFTQRVHTAMSTAALAAPNALSSASMASSAQSHNPTSSTITFAAESTPVLGHINSLPRPGRASELANTVAPAMSVQEGRHASVVGHNRARGSSLARSGGGSSNNNNSNYTHNEIENSAGLYADSRTATAAELRQELDHIDEALSVRYRLHVQLSSAKATVRNVLPNAEMNAITAAAAALLPSSSSNAASASSLSSTTLAASASASPATAPAVHTTTTATTTVSTTVGGKGAPSQPLASCNAPTLVGWRQALTALHTSAAAYGECSSCATRSPTPTTRAAGTAESTTGAVAIGNGGSNNSNSGNPHSSANGVVGGRNGNSILKQQQQQQQNNHCDTGSVEEHSRLEAEAYASRDHFFANPSNYFFPHMRVREGEGESVAGLLLSYASSASAHAAAAVGAGAASANTNISSASHTAAAARMASPRDGGSRTGAHNTGHGAAVAATRRAGNTAASAVNVNANAHAAVVAAALHHSPTAAAPSLSSVGGSVIEDGVSGSGSLPHPFSSCAEEGGACEEMAASAYRYHARLPSEQYSVRCRSSVRGRDDSPGESGTSNTHTTNATNRSDATLAENVPEQLRSSLARMGATAVTSDETTTAVCDSLVEYTERMNNGVRAMLHAQQEYLADMKTLVQQFYMVFSSREGMVV